MEPQPTKIPAFKELAIQSKKAPRCVDGRPDPTKVEKGPQMLGGSLHPVVLAAIETGSDLTAGFLTDKLQSLQSSGFETGVHRGSHKHAEDNKSDCGFADQMPKILETAVAQREHITQGLEAVYEAHKAQIGELPFRQILDTTFDRLVSYNPKKLTLTGEGLVQTSELAGSSVEDLHHDHAESIAYVNLKPGATFDTNSVNLEGQQAFNLDLWAATEQAKALGVSEEFALGASLILYQATEIVLVEAKGKPALPVVIHS